MPTHVGTSWSLAPKASRGERVRPLPCVDKPKIGCYTASHHGLCGSFIKLADGTIQRLGQDVEGVFGTKIWR